MSFSYDVYKNRMQRISLLSFRRATPVPPELNCPELDDRGYFREGVITQNPSASDVNLGIDRGPVVGVTEDDTVFVDLRRERIDNNAPLFVTSSDTATMKVVAEMGKDHLLNWESAGLRITGIKGSGGVLPKVANVEIRYGSPQGVIIGELRVYVFTRMWVNIIPHLVTLYDSNLFGLPHVFDINRLFEMVKAIWQPCGISFFIGAPEYDSIQSNINLNGKWGFPETQEMFNKARHSSDAINIYFINEIVSDDKETRIAGFTWDPKLARKRGEKPGIIVQTNDVLPSDLAHAVGHEIGHFLNLEHTDNRQIDKTKPNDNLRDDFWSEELMLMAPYGQFLSRGFLITMKDLYDINHLTVNHITDPEWITARKRVNSKEGPY